MSIISKLQKKGQETNSAALIFWARASQSMDRRWYLWAVILVYGPSMTSMGRFSGLWTVDDVYEPLVRSMGRRWYLWAVSSVYGPSMISMGR